MPVAALNKSAAAANSTPNDSIAAQRGPKPTNEQLSCLYNYCMKLLCENKINAKNAFQLKLIDHMADIVLNKEIVGAITDFQIVGCTIDAGTKIYAARVDSLHQSTYRMLFGLGHSAPYDEQRPESEMNGGASGDGHGGVDGMNVSGDEDDQSNKKSKKVKRCNKRSNQICENLDMITAKSKEIIDEDLYFRKISTCIEHEGISGIISNKIRIRDDSIVMLIDAEEKSASSFLASANPDNHTNNSQEINCKEIVDMCKSKSIEMRSMKLCVDMNSFKFIGWNADSNDEISPLMESMSHANDDLEVHRFDVNNQIMSHWNQTTQRVDVDIDDGPNDFNDPDVDNIDSERNEIMHSIAASHQSGLEIFDKIDDTRALHSVAELTKLVAHQPSDYSYFNFDKLRMHDLPRHLKAIANRVMKDDVGAPGAQVAGATAAAKNAKVRRKEAPRIDLSIDTDHTKLFRVTEKATYLCDRIIEKRSENPVRIGTERSCYYNARELYSLYWKQVPAKIDSDIESVEQALDDDDHIGGIDDDFEIPCTAQTNEPFFSQNGGEFGHTQDEPIHLHAGSADMLMTDAGAMPPMANFDGDNLVQAPLAVNTLNIEYAKTSKNIDVRRLKQVMWSLISGNNDKENISDLNGTADSTLNTSKRLSSSSLPINVSLKTLYNQLRPPVISKSFFDDLSICTCFQVLLFLANEHGLILKNDAIGSDINITNQF